MPIQQPALREVIDRIQSVCDESASAAGQRQLQLTKPAGSLGALEDAGIRLSAIQRQCPPRRPEHAVVVIFAADHGVHAQGVTPWPQEVTGAMVLNFLAGGAAVSVLAREQNIAVKVVDVGVIADLPDHPDLTSATIAPGTADLAVGPAMTAAQAESALLAGVAAAEAAIRDGADLLLTGDMGIANTTASAALIAAFSGADPAEVTGRGTGIDDATLAVKQDVVRRALQRVTADQDPLTVAADVGGFEHLALAGFVLGAAAHGVPVILDGVIAGASALIAQALQPHAVGYCFAGHLSAEPGHRFALETLALRPLLTLDLRLGEGTGAVLAAPLLRASAAILNDMATFDAAGVTNKTASA